MPRKFTTEEKSQILARVAEIGATAAAKEAGVHYNSILKWMKESKDTVKAGAEKIATMPGEALERIGAEIAAKEEEIRGLEVALKDKKAELKELQKAKAKAEKEKELFDAAEQKKQLVEAVMKSGKSLEEIMSFLNS